MSERGSPVSDGQTVAPVDVLRAYIGGCELGDCGCTACEAHSALDRLIEERDLLVDALRAICTTNDSGPWIEVYRAAGGGYEGLQAIAQSALAVAQP